MNKLSLLFEQKTADICSIFFTAGFPNLDDTATIIQKLSESGVDFIEVGMPYSDPLADGPTIQQSSDVALKNGMNLDILFEQLEAIKDTNATPLVLMGYLNQMLKYGEEKFCEKCVQVGIDTLILPDLPMIEYETHYRQLFEKYGLSTVFLITPKTPEDRIRKIDELTDTFIYVVASSSITGAKGEISKGQTEYFERVQSMNLKSKLIIGFGISNNETFNTACQYANGAIVGSAFIKTLAKNGANGVERFVKELVEGA